MTNKTLDEVTKSVRNSVKFSEFISLDDFENKVKRIARRYGGHDTIDQNGTSHRDIIVNGRKITWSPRQRGNERVLSQGVFEKAVQMIATTTNIPYEQLELYFKGSGKPYKRFKRQFEEEYGI